MISSISEGRKIIQQSFNVKTFHSNFNDNWNEQYEKYKNVLQLMGQLERDH